ncbi:GNAT family N-acetyltransferase [Levilactobacillus brevis]|uniref:GNAT family N-acetyltransferase n=1 Tax=Levilactobacillus brevis TaxID=1580 RepID=UPI001DAEBA16|nr:GNAT family N-acetyltransferase [Levilactobacillus brevis]
MLIAYPATPQDYPDLIALWQASVTATHTFLTPTDVRKIREQLPTYFAAVELTKWLDGAKLIGFSGRQGPMLAMLFIAPDSFRKGYGHQIIERLNQEQDLRLVDVNEQNPGALAFYQRQGFRIVSRDALDDAGQPYPILHLRRE